MVLPNSAQKQIFAENIFVVKLPTMPCICFERKLSRKKIFMAMLRPAKSVKNSNLENFGLYGSMCSREISFYNFTNLYIRYILSYR